MLLGEVIFVAIILLLLFVVLDGIRAVIDGFSNTANAIATTVTTFHLHQPVMGDGLVRMLGSFRCLSCRAHWQSKDVYCAPGTSTAIDGQECRRCSVTCMPYQVEAITCSACGVAYSETICVHVAVVKACRIELYESRRRDPIPEYKWVHPHYRRF